MSDFCMVLVIGGVIAWMVVMTLMWWGTAFLLALGIAALTFLAGHTPWNVVTFMGLAPLVAWWWLERRKQKPTPDADHETIRHPTCACPACTNGASQ